MTTPSSERQELLQHIADAYDPARHKVLLVSDTNHYETHEISGLVADVAEALRAKGVTAAGFEGVMAHDQPFFDSFAAHEISRTTFLKHLETAVPKQLSKRDAGVFWGHVADLIEGGIRVYGLGEAYYAPEIPDLEDLNFRYRKMATEMETDYLKFASRTQDLQSSPQAVYSRMLATVRNDPSFPGGMNDRFSAGRDAFGHIQSGVPGFSGEQVERVRQVDAGISKTPEPRDDDLYKRGVYRVFMASHPQYNELRALGEQLVPPPATTDDRRQRARLDTDSKVAAHIQEILKHEDGMVVQYGFAHTVRELKHGGHSAGIPDLDGALRKAGVGVMMVDPYFGAPGKIDCTPLLAPEDCAKLPAFGKEALAVGQSSNDPDRYIIPDIKGPTLTKNGPVQP